MDLESNTTKGIATGCGFDYVTECNICTKDEAKEITKEEIEQNNSSITMVDFIFTATGKPTDPDQEHKVFSEIVALISTFIDNSDTRFSVDPFRSSLFPFSHNRITRLFASINLCALISLLKNIKCKIIESIKLDNNCNTQILSSTHKFVLFTFYYWGFGVYILNLGQGFRSLTYFRNLIIIFV